jgi:hypothetical protein
LAYLPWLSLAAVSAGSVVPDIGFAIVLGMCLALPP